MVKQKNNRLSEDTGPLVGGTHPSGTRRRGKALEDAILLAAWDELNETGYVHLTMEGVAVRAKTNKAAIYRRWPSKSRLVIAAIHKKMPDFSIVTPDTGDLRKDVSALLHSIAQPMQMIGAETIHGLMVEYLSKELISAFPQMARALRESKLEKIMLAILKNAEKRGEVNLKKIKPRIISLPGDLLRYELLTTHEPLSEAKITEIVDDIFLPLVRSSV